MQPRQSGRRAFGISVIVSQEHATGDEVMETLHSLWADMLSADEMVVIGCHRHSKRYAPWLQTLKRYRYIEPKASESYIAARNRAAALCTNDILIFTDANIQAPSRWVTPLTDVFKNPAVAAAGPSIADLYQRDQKGYGMRWTNAELSTGWLTKEVADVARVHSVPLLPGIFLAVRRSTFAPLGGFDAGMRGIGGDDVELCFRLWMAGFRCVMVPNLEVHWMNPYARAQSISRSTGLTCFITWCG